MPDHKQVTNETISKNKQGLLVPEPNFMNPISFSSLDNPDEIKIEKKKKQDKLTPPMPCIKLTQASTEDWEHIKEAYMQQYPDNQLDDDGNTLYFADDNEAQLFFANQASQNIKFLVEDQIVSNGQPSNIYFFSCGSGKSFHGSLQEIKEELEKEAPDAQIEAGLKQINTLINMKQTKAMKRELLNQKEIRNQEQLDNQSPKELTPSLLN